MQLARKPGLNRPVFTTGDMLQLFVENTPALQSSPGDKFRYSRTGYVLLAEIVARVSVRSFEEFGRGELFEPLAMKALRVFNLLSAKAPENRGFGFKKMILAAQNAS